jgi:hypothetical protein
VVWARRARAPDPAAFTFHGGHEWTGEVAATVGRFLSAIA